MDHGGDLDRAMALYGGRPQDWLDLSTGINRRPYPVPALSAKAWTALPTRQDMKALCDAAARYYKAGAALTPMGGGAGGDPAFAAPKGQGPDAHHWPDL